MQYHLQVAFSVSVGEVDSRHFEGITKRILNVTERIIHVTEHIHLGDDYDVHESLEIMIKLILDLVLELLPRLGDC